MCFTYLRIPSIWAAYPEDMRLTRVKYTKLYAKPPPSTEEGVLLFDRTVLVLVRAVSHCS